MAYSRFRSLAAIIASCLAFVGHCLHVASDSLVSTFNAAVHYFDFKPNATDALALDRASHQAVMEDARSSPFKAFIERAKSHDLFSGDGFRFDPGRATV